MIALLFSILASSSLLIFFKLFAKYQVNTKQAIAINYLVGALTSILFINTNFSSIDSNDYSWIYTAWGLGTLFFIVFNLSSISTQKVSLGITSIAMKLGLIFPIILGIVFYKESFVLMNYIGLGLGILSLFFLTYTPSSVKNNEHSKWVYLMPIAVWIGSGICDSTVQMANKLYISHSNDGTFAFVAFSGAALAGLLFVFGIKREKLEFKSILGGIGLGIPNYFSIYFLFKCLDSLQLNYHLSSATIFTLNNISIVILSVFIGMFMFKEKLNKFNLIGIILALTGIVFISYKP